MKSLKDLKKLKIAPRKKQQPDPEPEPVNEPLQNLQSEENAFLQAMQGVKPLHGKGRDIALDKPVQTQQPDDADSSLDILNKLVNGHIEFDVEYSDEYIQGFIRGINSKTLRKLKAGHLSIEAHLDLHGLNAQQAKIRLLKFMREHYINNSKCVLLIPGRGINSPMGAPVLRSEIQGWLTREPLKRIVLAFCSAQPKHGGTGALYVLLRNYKKSGGKIFWERYLMDFEGL